MGWTKQNCAFKAEGKEVGGSRENEGKSMEGEGEGHSLMTGMESKLRSWGSKGQGWVVQSM